MLLKDREIDVIEYAPKMIKGVKKTGKPKSSAIFRTNLIRLAVAIAKCTFTKNPDKTYQAAESIINIIRVVILIHNSTDGRFLLNQVRLDLIRDFSKTTRIGELAQGMCFLFVQDILKIPTPYDFIGYCETVHKKTPIGSTPDFIGCYVSGTYDLVESKGSFDIKPKFINGRLNKALKQCEEGEVYLNSIHLANAKRKFGVLTVFESQNATSTDNSSIHFIDPAEEPQKAFDSWQLIVAYYDAIISGFTGLDSIKAFQIKDIEEVSFKQQKYKLFNINTNYLNFDIPLFIGYPRYIKFGISITVLELIANEKANENEYFAEIKKINEENFNENSFENNSYELFSDGTIFKFRR